MGNKDCLGTWRSYLHNELQQQPFSIAKDTFSRIQVRFGAKFLHKSEIKICEKSILKSLNGLEYHFWHERNPHLGSGLKNCSDACLGVLYLILPHPRTHPMPCLNMPRLNKNA